MPGTPLSVRRGRSLVLVLVVIRYLPLAQFPTLVLHTEQVLLGVLRISDSSLLSSCKHPVRR